MRVPRERDDYRIAAVPLFLAPFGWIVECVHTDCGGYDSGQQTRYRDALDAYYGHWRLKHQSVVHTPGSIPSL